MSGRPLFWTLLIGVLLLPLVVLYLQLNKLDQLLHQKRYPFLLFVTIDTLRADRLSCYGNDRIKTPNLNRLVKEGVLFRDFYCQIPITNPSHCSIFTGLSPYDHGILTNGVPLAASRMTLARKFKEIGYRTAAFISGFSLVRRVSGLQADFETFDDGWSKSQVERSSRATTDAVISWLHNSFDHNKERGFFWVHYFDPHQPYAPPAPYDEMYVAGSFVKPPETTPKKAEEYEQNAETAKKAGFFHVLVKDSMTTHAPPEEVNLNLSRYDGEISMVDAQLGRLLRELSKLDMLQRTMIVITADHGEGFDHDYFFAHGDRLYDSALHVPALFWMPDMRTPLIASYPGQSIDFFPTLLETFHFFSKSQTPGNSLASVLRGVASTGERDLISVTRGLNRPGMSLGPMMSYISGRWKAIYQENNGKYELFNLLDDPSETTNLWGSKPRIQAELAGKIAAKLRSQPHLANSPPLELESEDKERLKELGYVQ